MDKYFDDNMYNELITEDDEIDEGPQWAVTYRFNVSEYDDNMENTNITKLINAVDFDAASKYAEQHIRIMRKEDPKWESAEIIAIQKRD